MDKLTQLKQQAQSIREKAQQDHNVRLHRAISWYKAADDTDIDDIRFINLWIAFHACHFVDSDVAGLSDQSSFCEYIHKVVDHDKERHLYQCLWQRYSGPVKALIKNPYVFAPFWDCQRIGSNEWQKSFELSSVDALNALS